jgi:hypothetical protein
MSESTELALIDSISDATAPAIYVKDGLKPFLEAVKAEVGAEVPDLATRKGRDRIASLAAKVSKSKVAVEKPGREYLKRLKEMPKVVEEELREFTRAMDLLRDETRRPLTEWEEVEEDRVAGLRAGVEELRDLSACLEGLDSAAIKERLAKVTGISLGARWEEYEAEAARAKDRSVAVLIEARDLREQHEEQLAAIAKFQAEQAERDAQAERDRIARKATEHANREAEAKAQAYRENVAREAAEAEAATKRRELELKLEAEASARRELEAKQRADQAERDAIEQKAAADRARIVAEQQAAQEKIDAQARQEAAVEAERKAALQRQADEAARVEREAKAREADRAHKGSVLKGAKEAIMGAGLSEEQAKAVVKLIAAGQVPNVKIQY